MSFEPHTASLEVLQTHRQCISDKNGNITFPTQPNNLAVFNFGNVVPLHFQPSGRTSRSKIVRTSGKALGARNPTASCGGDYKDLEQKGGPTENSQKWGHKCFQWHPASSGLGPIFLIPATPSHEIFRPRVSPVSPQFISHALFLLNHQKQGEATRPPKSGPVGLDLSI